MLPVDCPSFKDSSSFPNYPPQSFKRDADFDDSVVDIIINIGRIREGATKVGEVLHCLHSVFPHHDV